MTLRKTVFAVAALSLASLTSTQASAQNQNDGQGTAHLVKDCSKQIITQPWSFCTIISSDISKISEHSVVYYTQASDIVSGLVDSNVLLDAGNGNLATGRCTFYFQTSPAIGLCKYTDGIGQLAGFQARFVVTPTGSTTYSLIGPYQFKDVNDLTAQQD